MTTLVARCPHCDTAFRVVPEQLRVRQGRVRCGVCHEVFDGNAALLKAGLEPVLLRAADPVAAAPVVAPLAPGLPQAGSGRAEPVLGAAHLPPGADAGREPSIVAQHAAVSASARVGGRGVEPSLGGGRSVWRDAGSSSRATAARLEVAPPEARAVGATRPQPWPAEPRAGRPEPEVGDGSPPFFDPVVDRPQFVASRPDAPLPPLLAAQAGGGVSRLLFSLGFWLALLVLLVQALWWWRTPLATHVPALRAPFQMVCQSFGCEVGYVRAPLRLAIVSSSVQPAILGGAADVQHLQLQAVLRNRAPHPQPWPALEITLTDHTDAVVAKRVVPPEVYLPAGQSREPFGAGSDREIYLALSARGAPVSGYRLNLFYP